MKATIANNAWRALVFGELVKVSHDTLRNFFCDYYMDAQYLSRAKAPCDIWYAFSETSTQLYVDETCTEETTYRKLLSDYENIYVVSVVPQDEKQVSVEMVRTSM